MSRIFKTAYALLALVALAAALLVGLSYVAALVGGGSFAQLASSLADSLKSVAIYTASFAMLSALISMYVTGEHYLRIDTPTANDD